MKYKVGDVVRTTKDIDEGGVKVFPIGTIGVIDHVRNDQSLPYKVAANGMCWYYSEDMLEPYFDEKSYTKGLADAWEAAKRLYDTTHEDRNKIFGLDHSCNGILDVFERFTVEEVLAKFKAYDDSIVQVGDVVTSGVGKGVVTRKEGKNIFVMWSDGSCGEDADPKTLHKTGEHIDLAPLLKQIGE